jgi:hypothetical protein
LVEGELYGMEPRTLQFETRRKYRIATIGKVTY